MLVVLGACARQGYPTGGPKDEQPPVALGSKPQNESRHFAEKEFFIQFDEYVVLKNATENVLVSPPMKEKPEYTTKGKGVLVKIKDTLQENTTYLFQFKEAIADFTEGNLLPSYEYVFSTGEAMDTMALSGQVLDARNGKPWKETVTVMAYRMESGEQRAENDTMATTEQPNFVTRCDKEGNFAFHYIPEGRYRLVALEDKNRNLRVDITDAVAWDTAAVASHPVADSTRRQHYFISQPDNRQQRITKSEFTGLGHIVIATQMPMERPVIDSLEAEWRLNSRRDTLTLWCLDTRRDSARFVISDPSGLQDTLKLRYSAPRRGGRRTVAGAKEEKTPLMKPLCDGSKAYYDDLHLAFTTPIVGVADSAMAEIMYLKDSTVSLSPVTLDADGLQARIETCLKSGEQYRIRMDEGLFTDVFGNRSDSLTFTLTPKDYGILSIEIDNRMGVPLVVEVLDSKDTVVATQSLGHSATLRFLHLPAGDYRLRAVVDADSNGRWTTGDYRAQRQPEQSLMFEKTLSLRERWEMEEKWTVEKEKKQEGSMERKLLMPKKEAFPESLVKPERGQ